MRFAKVAGLLLAVAVVAQLSHTLDGSHARWEGTPAAHVAVGPYNVRVPSGWRDARELAAAEMRDHVAGEGITLVPTDAPLRERIDITWRTAQACDGVVIRVAGDDGCMSTFGDREQIAIRRGDHEIVVRGNITAVDEAVAGLTSTAPERPVDRPSV